MARVGGQEYFAIEHYMNIMDTISKIREPQVAGMFYPAEPEACAALVARSLAAAKPSAADRAKLVIAPHAGHVYSGPIAATVYKPLEKARDRISRVVLVGVAHRVPFKGIVTTGATHWKTPLGLVPIDGDWLHRAGVPVMEEAFAGEHSLEVHLPFLQTVLGDFALLPLIVGGASHQEVADVLERVWGGPETLIVISSDMSHFHDYETAQRLDAATRAAIEALEPERLSGEGACGYRAIGGALLQARKRDMRVTGVDFRNSGDTAGARDRVVGYGAFIMEYAHDARLGETERGIALDAVRQALKVASRDGEEPRVKSWHGVPEPLKAMRASFVTLTSGGRLRGCVGSLVAQRPLLADIVANARNAGFQDRRFDPLSAGELAGLDIEVSVLSYPRPIAFASEAELVRAIRPDVDGLILTDGNSRGLFLPSVWESLPDVHDFLRQLKRKAGLAPDHWSKSLRVHRFTAEKFGAPFGPIVAGGPIPATEQ